MSKTKSGVWLHEGFDSLCGTSLQGLLPSDIRYSDIVAVFGEPNFGRSDDNKVQAKWGGDIDGVIFTIYDYKEYGTPVEEVTSWYVGGRESEAFELVLDLLSKGHRV